MEKKNVNKKLSLKKETVASLNNLEMNLVNGGLRETWDMNVCTVATVNQNHCVNTVYNLTCICGGGGGGGTGTSPSKICPQEPE